MKTNLIQSYLNGNQQYNSDNARKNFDVNKELTYRTFIKPLPSNGQLVKTSLFDIPSEIFKDSKYNLKAFKNSLSGNANDNELGRLNDLGMKLGGLSIATYLYSRKSTPLTKIMEFVGLGSFLASMDIWPKLALQLPAYLIHGFDIRQQYRDNYGTKKPVFQDHQFIPWDLYSEEEINRIGDRMNVPKDMKNRRDFIQEKMRKIALQNNTMWMLTSGFATPIMSALICNALEKPIANFQDKRINEKADKLLENFSEESKKYSFSKVSETLDSILAENKNKEISDELFKKILCNITDGMDDVTSEYIKEDLKRFSKNKGFNIDVNIVRNVLQNKFKGEFSSLVPSAEVISQKFKDLNLPLENVKEFSKHLNAIQDIMYWNVREYEAKHPELKSMLEFKLQDMLYSEKEGLNSSDIIDAFKSKSNFVLSEDLSNRLKSISLILNKFKAENIVLDKFAYIKTAQAPETILANCWNEMVGDEILKTLGINSEDIKKNRFDREPVGKLLREKFEKIASNDDEYKNVVEVFERKLSYLENKTNFADIDKYSGDLNNLYKKYVMTTFNDAAKDLKALGMVDTAERLIGYEITDTTSLKDIQLSFLIDRVKGVKSSFYRILNALDVYRRIAKMENVDWALHAGVPKNVQSEMIELVKQLLIDGHASDFAVKFYYLRNPSLNKETVKNAGAVELPYDRGFFNGVMKLMYGQDIHPDTDAGLKGSIFRDNFLKYRQDILNYLGGDKYFAFPNVLVDGKEVQSSSEKKSLLLGCAPDEMFEKLFSRNYNGKKWLKMFGTMGISLLGLTIFSQFFMGKMNKNGGNK
ncbi:hypothetical protein J6G99_02315 [bacterium]|nr:hypothetical protein [bacterium]